MDKVEAQKKRDEFYESAWNSLILNQNMPVVLKSTILNLASDLMAKRAVEKKVNVANIINVFIDILKSEDSEDILNYFNKLPTNSDKLSFIINTKLVIISSFNRKDVHNDYCNDTLYELKILFKNLKEVDVIEIIETYNKGGAYVA